MKKHDVAVVGEIYTDHIFTGFARWPQPGEEVYAPQYAREVGGGAAITACALAKLGRSVNLVGIIGADDAGWMEDRLKMFGVSGDGLSKKVGNTGVTVSVSIREERSFFSHAGVNKDLPMALESEAMAAVLGQARHVHFALPLERETALQLLPRLRDQGCTTSLDVGFHPEWLQALPNLEICRAVDYFFPNEKEAALICGAEHDDYLTYAGQQGVLRPVVKLGQLGAAMLANGIRHEAPSPSTVVIDTTGAGDVFDAGFIDAHLDGASPQDSLRRACACGALSTRAAGALSALPDRMELKRMCGPAYGT
jgi:sugar/nucleoside kinase (ribokinase family)